MCVIYIYIYYIGTLYSGNIFDIIYTYILQIHVGHQNDLSTTKG